MRYIRYYYAAVAKYGKDRKGNKEDIPLLKKARSYVSSEKFTKKDEVLKDLRHPRWRPWRFQALAVVASLAFFASSALSAHLAFLARFVP